MDWNTDGPNTVEIPGGAAKIAVYPVVEMLRVRGGKIHKAFLDPKLDALHRRIFNVPEGATEISVEIDIPERLRITGVKAFSRGPVVRKKASDGRKVDQKPPWEFLAEWELPAGREKADADLAALKAED
jgi:hypothetical protein